MEVLSDHPKTNVLRRIGSQPVALAAAALVFVVLGASSVGLWRAYTGNSPEQERTTSLRLMQARATQASEQLVEKTRSLEVSQQESIDQLQAVQDQLQVLKRPLSNTALVVGLRLRALLAASAATSPVASTAVSAASTAAIGASIGAVGVIGAATVAGVAMVAMAAMVAMVATVRHFSGGCSAAITGIRSTPTSGFYGCSAPIGVPGIWTDTFSFGSNINPQAQVQQRPAAAAPVQVPDNTIRPAPNGGTSTMTADRKTRCRCRRTSSRTRLAG